MIRKMAVMTLSLALIVNTGCTSLQTIEATEAAVVEYGLKVGDKVVLYRTGHLAEDVRILKLSESELTATRKDGTVIVVEWRDINGLEVVKFHPFKTAGAGVGIVVLVVVAVAIIIYLAVTEGGAPYLTNAPAGSNRSNCGGNEMVEASGEACYELVTARVSRP